MIAELPDPQEDWPARALAAEEQIADLRDAATAALQQRDAACEEVADALTEIARLRRWLSVIAGESAVWRSVLSRRRRGQWTSGSRCDAVLNARRIANLALGGSALTTLAATAAEQTAEDATGWLCLSAPQSSPPGMKWIDEEATT